MAKLLKKNFLVFLCVVCLGGVFIPPSFAVENIDKLEKNSSSLTGDILFRFLLAEIAADRGHPQEAYNELRGLAERTKNGRIAYSALEIAVRMNALPQAVRASELWYQFEPDTEDAFYNLINFLLQGDDVERVKVVCVQRLKGVEKKDRPLVANRIQELLLQGESRGRSILLLKEILNPYWNEVGIPLIMAKAALKAQDKILALESAKIALQQDADSEEAVMMVSRSQSNLLEATNILLAFVERHQKANQVYLEIARLLVVQKRYEEAINQWMKVLKNNPNEATAAYGLGVLFAQKEDHVLAEKYLVNYVKILEERNAKKEINVQALLILSNLAEMRGDLVSALTWLERISNDQVSGASLVHFSVVKKRANFLVKQEKVEEALQLLRDYSALNTMEEASVILMSARILYEVDNVPAAILKLEEGLKRFPQSTDIMYDYALMLERADRLVEMEKILRELMIKTPNNAIVYNALGFALAERNIRIHEAAELITKALKLAPDDAMIIDSMGWVEYRLGNLDKAEVLLRRAYQMYPDIEVALHLAELLWVKKEYEEAKNFFRAAKLKEGKKKEVSNLLKRLNITDEMINFKSGS
jgi:tetratricopeptide (TPR) repeat protein